MRNENINQNPFETLEDNSGEANQEPGKEKGPSLLLISQTDTLYQEVEIGV